MHRIACFAVASLLVGAAPVVAAGPAVADLFPADTLAYAEVREPAKVAPQVTAALAGSRLADVMKLIDAHRDAAKTPHDLTGKQQLAVLGLVASPELAAEVGKLGGVGAGLTGFNATGEPEAAVAVLTGDTAAAGLAARAFLSLASVRRVGAVDGVPVYQFRHPRFSFDPNTGQQKLDNDKPPEEGAYEATAAYTPGLFVYGTSKVAVGAVLTRYRGKGANGLGGVAAFRAARDAHPHPGVFVYTDAAALVTRLDEVRRASEGGPEPDALGWFRLLADDKSVRHVAGTIRLRDGGLVAELSASFAPGRASPLLALLSGPGVKTEFLGPVPSSAATAVAVTFPEKERAAAVVGLLDAAAKASGGLGRTPSEAIKELETRFKVSVADELIGKTRAVTVFTPTGAAGKAAQSFPTIVLHADSPAVAAAWEDFLPKLAADVGGGEPVQPSSEVVDGVKVLSLPGTDLPWRAGIHYARKDAVVAVGLDRAVVAAAVTAGPAAVQLPADNPAALAGFVRVGGMIKRFRAEARPTGPVVPVNPPPRSTPRAPSTPPPPPPTRPGVQPGGSAPPHETQMKTEEKALDAVWAALDALPAMVVTARRDGADLRVEVRQVVGKDGFAPVVDAAVAWFDTYLNRTDSFPPGVSGSFRRLR